MEAKERAARIRGWKDARWSAAKAIEEVTGRPVADGGEYVNDIKSSIRSYGRECYEAALSGEPMPGGE